MSELLLIKERLRPLGLYDLSEDSIIHAELMAYNRALELVTTKLEEIERECFISTAETYGLSLIENNFGYESLELSAANRRLKLLSRMAITSNDFTKKSIEEAIKSSGLNVEIVENKGENNIYINCIELFDNTNTMSKAIDEAKKFIPAHVSAEFDYRVLSWDYIDNKDLAFSAMDAKDLTWTQIDAYEE